MADVNDFDAIRSHDRIEDLVPIFSDGDDTHGRILRSLSDFRLFSDEMNAIADRSNDMRRALGISFFNVPVNLFDIAKRLRPERDPHASPCEPQKEATSSSEAISLNRPRRTASCSS